MTCNKFCFQPLTKKTLKIMTLQEAYSFFERLKTETTKKYEIKDYEKFLYILTELKLREFSKDEIQSIEKELDSLDLKSNPKNSKKHFKKALKEFKIYLKEKHSLVSARHYTNLYISLGSSFGIILGIIIGERTEKSLGIALGISIGILIGLTIGRHMDSQVKAAGNML